MRVSANQLDLWVQNPPATSLRETEKLTPSTSPVRWPKQCLKILSIFLDRPPAKTLMEKVDTAHGCKINFEIGVSVHNLGHFLRMVDSHRLCVHGFGGRVRVSEPDLFLWGFRPKGGGFGFGFGIRIYLVGPTWWSSRGSSPQESGGYVSKFTPHEALKLIARGKMTFDERAVLHRVAPAARIACRDASEPEDVSWPKAPEP